MDFIKGINFATFARRGTLASAAAQRSLDAMIEDLSPNMVFLPPAAVQATAQSEDIDFASERTMGDEELIATIRRLHAQGLRVALKPTVNCLNGTWRAHINFFDIDVPCEPKWRNWFASYTAFQLHYAAIAQREGCEMFLPGCEMVMADRREEEWRTLIHALRGVYSGLISYNCDKYQEDHVAWWDCVDVISSSGYYPIDDWPRQLDRIEQVVQRFRKPFFFAELGCMATEGSSARPNDWSVQGDYAPEEQAAWYGRVFEEALRRPFVGGFAFWDWAPRDARPGEKGYNLRGTEAARLTGEVYRGLQR